MRSVCLVALVAGLGVALGVFAGCGSQEETCSCFAGTDGGLVTTSSPSPSAAPSGSPVSLVSPDASYSPADAAASPTSCRFGSAAPVGLVTNLVDPQGLAVRAGTLYITDPGAGTVASIATDGGALTVLASKQQVLAGLAVDDHAVYFASASGLSSVPLAGGGVTSIAAGVIATGAVAVDANHAYFAAADPSTPGSTVALSVPIGGGALTPLGTASQEPTGLSVASTGVYWTTGVFTTDDAGTDFTGTVDRQPGDGGAVQTLAAGPFVPLAVLVDGSDVFYSAQPSGLSRVGVDGGPTTALTTDGYGSSALAVDDENVYFVGQGGISCVPRGGGATIVLASEQDFAVAIAVDASGLYWMTQPPGPDAFGRLVKLAR